MAEHDSGAADGFEVKIMESMSSREDFAWHERQLGVLMLAGICACIAGYGLGMWGAEIGGGAKPGVGTVLMRGCYCALLPVILAWFTRAAWLFLVPAYMIGFGMSFGMDLTLGIRDSIMTFCFFLEGKRMVVSPPLSHADLPWIFAIMLWLTGLTAILRRSKRFGREAIPPGTTL